MVQLQNQKQHSCSFIKQDKFKIMDIVDYIEQEVEKLGWVFSYGNKANQNLLLSDIVDDRTYFLLDIVKEDEGVSEYGGQGAIVYSGTFLILVKSDIDNVYHAQKGQDKSLGRYNKNIKPLKTALNLFKDVIDCSEYERQSWSKLEVINELDVNFDGLIITYKLKKL